MNFCDLPTVSQATSKINFFISTELSEETFKHFPSVHCPVSTPRQQVSTKLALFDYLRLSRRYEDENIAKPHRNHLGGSFSFDQGQM